MEKDGRTFTRDEIDRVKRENPVEDVVARYVPLRRRGHASALIGRGRWFADQLDRMANGTFVENRPTTHP